MRPDLGIEEDRLEAIKEKWATRLSEIVLEHSTQGGHTVETVMEEMSKLLNDEGDVPQKTRDWIMLKTGQAIAELL